MLLPSLHTRYTEDSPQLSGRTLFHVPSLAQSRRSPLWHRRAGRPPGGPLRPSPLAAHRHPCHCCRTHLPLRLARRDAQRRPPPPPRRYPRNPGPTWPPLGPGFPARLLAIQNRLSRHLHPAHLLPPRHRPRLPSRPGDHALPAVPHRLDLSPHSAPFSRLRRSLPLTTGLAPLPDSRAPPQAESPNPHVAPAPRNHRPDSPQDPPLRPALHDRRPSHRLPNCPADYWPNLFPRPQGPALLRHVAGLRRNDLHPPPRRSSRTSRRLSL